MKLRIIGKREGVFPWYVVPGLYIVGLVSVFLSGGSLWVILFFCAVLIGLTVIEAKKGDRDKYIV